MTTTPDLCVSHIGHLPNDDADRGALAVDAQYGFVVGAIPCAYPE